MGFWQSLFKSVPAEPLPRKQYIANPPSEYVALDIETTGLDPRRCSIVQIAAVKYQDGIEIDFFSSLVNPIRSIPYEATQMHGITNDMVRDAPFVSKLKIPLSDFIGDSEVLGYNFWRFDRKFLVAAYGEDYCSWWIQDVYLLALQTLRKQPSYKLTNLAHKIGFCGVSHNALWDCRATAALFNYLCRPSDSISPYQIGHRNKMVTPRPNT